MNKDLQSSYDSVAADYAEHFRDELERKPFDRKMLDLLIEKVGQNKVICDMGCGPGQIARYIHDNGGLAYGIDLSKEMIKEAKRLNPNIGFEQGDMLSLKNVPDCRFSGIAAFYSIIHIPTESVVQVLSEFKRVLVPGGVLLLTHHIGREVVHRDDWWGKKVSLDFLFFETAQMKNYLLEAGFVLEEVIEREPYPDFEYQSRRAYIFARTL